MSSYDPVAKLRAMFPDSPGTYTFTFSDAVVIMVYAREILEGSDTKSQHPILNLFCNWTVHTELEGSLPAYRFLCEATTILLATASTTEREERISEALSSARLRSELLKLFNAHGIPTHILNSVAGWMMFGGQFFKAIVNKKLRFPADPETHRRASPHYLEMKTQAGSRWSEAALTFRLINDHPEHPNKLQWCIERVDGIEVSGQYLNLETDGHFSHESYMQGETPSIRAPNT